MLPINEACDLPVCARVLTRAVIVDENPHLHSVDQLRRFSRSGFSTVVFDTEIGRDLTCVLMA
jgi:hypothetical protein